MRVLYISLIIILTDQLSKFFVRGFKIPFLGISVDGMYHGQRIPVIGDFFRLTFIENPGMAFGIDPGIDFKMLISLFSLAASIGLLFYLYHVRKESKSLKIALAFILGGAAGNLIDRVFYGVIFNYAPLFYGRVVDFLDFDFFNVTIFGKSYDRWPIFNIADSAVTIGVLILLLFYRQPKKEEPQPAAVSDGSPENIEPARESISESTAKPEQSEETRKESDTDNGEPGKGKEIPL